MSDLPRVLVTVHIPADHLAPLHGLAEIVMPDNGNSAAPRSQVLELIHDCTAVISQGELKVDRELLDAAPALRMVANVAMGIDNLDLGALTERGIVASNTPDAFAESTADHTLGLLLDLTRRISEGDRFVRSGEWANTKMEPLRWEGTLAGGKTLGMIGYGRIAKMVESRARAFGMNVLHTRSKPSDEENYRDLDPLLAESDVIVVLVPHTPNTHHLINADTLAKMKRGSFFINVARGKVMDEAAVVAALKSGQLAGAAFDVYEEEPIVSPELLLMEKVVMTPHTGGATKEQRKQGRLEGAENVARFLQGEPLLHPVNPA